MIKSKTGDVILDQEILKKSVDGLTDEQANKMVELATNILSIKTGEIHGQYDQDFSQAFGKTKPHGLKTYEWFKTEMADLTAKLQAAGTGTQEAEQLRAKIKELETSGATDEAIKQKAMDLEARVQQLTQLAEQKDQEWGAKIQEEQKKAANLKVDFEFQRALSGLKFKSDEIIPPAVRDTFISNAKAKITQQYKPDWQDGKLIFRDANGMTVNNPDNAYNAATPQELLLKEIAPIIDNGHQQPGAGTGPGAGSGAGSQNVPSIGQARSQAEAATLISQDLMRQGLTRGSSEFQTKLDEAWTANDVGSLPIQ